AAATLLKSGGRVSRLEHTGLPLGILPQVGFAHSRDTLSEGDVLLILAKSHGAWQLVQGQRLPFDERAEVSCAFSLI
ncbi:MAG: hypothetical protein J6U87_04365, partial [Clostridia bacterium]|nr:hypothetical protein [Clostridia bacterium]